MGFVWMHSIHPRVTRQPCPSLVLFTQAAQSSVAAVVTQKELKTTARSLDLKFPTGGVDLTAFANVFQGSSYCKENPFVAVFKQSITFAKELIIQEKSVVTKQEKSLFVWQL